MDLEGKCNVFHGKGRKVVIEWWRAILAHGLKAW